MHVSMFSILERIEPALGVVAPMCCRSKSGKNKNHPTMVTSEYRVKLRVHRLVRMFADCVFIPFCRRAYVLYVSLRNTDFVW